MQKLHYQHHQSLNYICTRKKKILEKRNEISSCHSGRVPAWEKSLKKVNWFSSTAIAIIHQCLLLISGKNDKGISPEVRKQKKRKTLPIWKQTESDVRDPQLLLEPSAPPRFDKEKIIETRTLLLLRLGPWKRVLDDWHTPSNISLNHICNDGTPLPWACYTLSLGSECQGV